jgi:GDP-fucose protein O-fucosyltransferase
LAVDTKSAITATLTSKARAAYMVRLARKAVKRRLNTTAGLLGILVLGAAVALFLSSNDTLNRPLLLLEASPPASAPQTDNEEEDGDDDDVHRVAGLSCDKYGGPSTEAAVQEMVYWHDIPSDAKFQSPYTKASSTSDQEDEEELYLTFEPDEGGWNNIRMAMETAVALAVSMGRTLVLPPKMRFYLLWHGGSAEKDVIGFSDFFHVDSVEAEHSKYGGLRVISFEEFLELEAMTGQLKDPDTGLPSFPPDNRTDWNGAVVNFQGASSGGGKVLWEWMRRVATVLPWSFEQCVVALPARPGKEAADNMNNYLEQVRAQDQRNFPKSGSRSNVWRLRWNSYNGRPTPVNASATERLAELLAHRNRLCVYDERLQNAKIVHALGETKTGFRILVHFYAFLFFEDWKQDLWIKRFIRDHFRYLDEIQCGAARVIEQVRQRAQDHGNVNGRYDAFHIRRGDFQYLDVRLSAEEIYSENSRSVVPDGRTVFIATDERNKTFFDPFREHYHLVFLDDFADQIKDISPNHYGMLDQLVASRGDVFMGAFYSTFTGYINRMRGYHAQKQRLQGFEDGLIESYYYVPKHLEGYRSVMRTYGAVQPAFWQQEFHVAWRDLDHDVAGNRGRREP